MGRSLQEQLDGPEPEPWIPEEGDSVLGEIEAIDERGTDWGPKKFVTVLTAAGELLTVACWDTVCANKIDELEPAVGDMIGFKFLGEKSNKSGSATYKNWSVKLARAVRPTTPVGAAAAIEAGFDDDANI